METKKVLRVPKVPCSTCKRCFSLERVVKSSRRFTQTGSKQYWRCRPCNAALCRKFRATPLGKQTLRRAIERYEKKNPMKRRAWELSRNIPLEPCEVCGTKKKIHRHHDNYLKPLEVRFLCPLHHVRYHKTKRLLKARGDL